MLRFACLGSGSKGNATLVAHDETLLLVDCGFSVSELERRLAQLELCGQQISAVLVTHEHADHIGGVARVARRYRMPVWMTSGTFAAGKDQDIPNLHLFHAHDAFQIGSILVNPFPVPHDAREPCQFVFEAAERRLGLLTDLGHITAHVRDCLKDCHSLLLEFNHDEQLLACGPYPPALKTRVGGDYGHLSNRQAGDCLQYLCQQGSLKQVIAMHLSEQNNAREKTAEVLEACIAGLETQYFIAEQDAVIDWKTV